MLPQLRGEVSIRQAGSGLEEPGARRGREVSGRSFFPRNDGMAEFRAAEFASSGCCSGDMRTFRPVRPCRMSLSYKHTHIHRSRLCSDLTELRDFVLWNSVSPDAAA